MHDIASYPAGVGGILTRVLEAGDGSSDIVLLHGLGARADRWRATLPILARAGWRCLALDFPGHGFATKGARLPCGVPALAGFVLAFLRDRAIERAVIVGTSLGGHVAAYMASQCPEQVRALVLVGALGLQPLDLQTRQKICAGASDLSRDGIEAKLRLVFADPSFVTERFIDEEWRINNSPGASESLSAVGNYIVQHGNDHLIDESLRAADRRFPTLLVWGERDCVIPLSVGQQALARKTVDALEVIPGCGHAPYLEDPEGFCRILLRFLERL